MTKMQKISKVFYEVRRRVGRLVFIQLPLLLTDNQLEVLRKLRLVSAPIVPLALVMIVFGVGTWSSKSVAAAGMLLDIAGFFRILLNDEWDKTLDLYADESMYPYGPPSYVMREYFLDLNPEAVTEEEDKHQREIASYFYNNRGVLLIIAGLLLQLGANFM